MQGDDFEIFQYAFELFLYICKQWQSQHLT